MTSWLGARPKLQERKRLNGECACLYRGVSSTVKLSVSKTELGGSNPSAPARNCGRAPLGLSLFALRGKVLAKSEEPRVKSDRRGAGAPEKVADGEVSSNRERRRKQAGHLKGVAAAREELLQRRPHRDAEGHHSVAQRSPGHDDGGGYHRVSVRRVFLGGRHRDRQEPRPSAEVFERTLMRQIMTEETIKTETITAQDSNAPRSRCRMAPPSRMLNSRRIRISSGTSSTPTRDSSAR